MGAPEKANGVRAVTFTKNCHERERRKVKQIIKNITDGPGELDILVDIRRKSCGHPQMVFDGRKRPVMFSRLGTGGGNDPDNLWLAGVVMCHHQNQYRYHGFTATFNVRTRQGKAEFETACRDCGTEVHEFGNCPKCDPCPRCNRRACRPHGSCMNQPRWDEASSKQAVWLP